MAVVKRRPAPLCPAAVKLAAQVDKLKASLATADMDRRHQRGKRKEAEAKVRELTLLASDLEFEANELRWWLDWYRASNDDARDELLRRCGGGH